MSAWALHLSAALNTIHEVSISMLPSHSEMCSKFYLSTITQRQLINREGNHFEAIKQLVTFIDINIHLVSIGAFESNGIRQFVWSSALDFVALYNFT